MKHIFSSGEILYSKNTRKLEEGSLVAESITYEKVSEGSEYHVEGEIDGQSVSVTFKIKKDCYGDLNFKYMVHILMQSDLFMAEWEEYKISYK